MKSITIIIIITIINIIFPLSAFAQINDIGYSRIDPASPLYFLKTVKESIEMSLAQTQRVKDLRKLEFATRRLREAKTLVGKNEDLIPPTLERYAVQLNSLTDKHIKNDPFADELKNNLSVHLKVLQQVYDQAKTARAKMFIRSALNRVIKRADVANLAKIPVCLLFAKEASSSALNQTEQVVLKQRSQDCFKSLNLIP